MAALGHTEQLDARLRTVLHLQPSLWRGPTLLCASSLAHGCCKLGRFFYLMHALQSPPSLTSAGPTLAYNGDEVADLDVLLTQHCGLFISSSLLGVALICCAP